MPEFIASEASLYVHVNRDSWDIYICVYVCVYMPEILKSP